MESIYENLELPSMPQVITRILEINENEMDIGLNQLETLISSDPNLVSKILKLANSPFYSRANNISDLGRALSLLGFKSIKSLTLLVSIARLLPNLSQNTSTQKELWMNSIIMAVTGKILAGKLGHRNLQEKVFLGALLRHIGQLILYNRFPTSDETAIKQSSGGMDIENLQKYELHLFGVSTFSLSEFAMETWNFPDDFINVADIIDYSPADVEKKAGIIGMLVCFSEILTYAKKLEENKLNPDLQKKLTEDLESYFNYFSVNPQTRDFIKYHLGDTFKNNEFYSFCEELFSL